MKPESKRMMLVAGKELAPVGKRQPISVTFDTNVIENVVTEGRAKENGLGAVFYALRRGLINGCVAYSYFVHDAIKRGTRIDKLRDGMEVRIPSNPLLYQKGLGMKFVQTAVVSPDSFHRETAGALRSLNMKVLDFKRAYWPTTPLDLPVSSAPDDYNDRIRAIQITVEDELHCGFYRLREYMRIEAGNNGDDLSLLFQLKSEQGKAFNRAYSEAADGDAVIAHYGYGIDLFCTDDRASNAGSQSVFSLVNKRILSERLGINFVSSMQLVDIINEMEWRHV